MKDISFLNTINSNKESDIIDLSINVDDDNNSNNSNVDDNISEDIYQNNIIQAEMYKEGLDILLDLIVKYKYEDIIKKSKIKENLIIELLEIINKYKFISQEIEKNISDKLLRAIFPYVEVYNKIIEGYKIDYTITIIEEDIKEARISKRKYRNDFIKQKYLFLKCQSLFKTLKIFTNIGVLNIVISIKISLENKRMFENIINFLKNIFKYENILNLKWLIDKLFDLKVFKLLFTIKSILIIELLEIIIKRFNYLLINKINKNKKLYNIPIEEVLKNEHQRLYFKEKLILKGIESNKYELSKNIIFNYKTYNKILTCFQNMNLFYFIPINIIDKNYIKSIYFSTEIIDIFIIKYKEKILEYYEIFIEKQINEFEKKVDNFLFSGKKETNSLYFSADLSSELSNANNLNTIEKKEVKQLRNIIKDSYSENEIEDIEDLSFENEYSTPTIEIINIFKCLRNFEKIVLNKQNIEHGIKQIEFFNIALLKNLEKSFLNLSTQKNADEKAFLSPVFYLNIDIYLQTTFLKHSIFKEKNIKENFNDYFLLSVVVYYNFTFFKELSFFDFESFKTSGLKKEFFKLLKNQEIINNYYLFLEKSLQTCEIKANNEICLFCKSKGFEKCKIFYIMNLLNISLFETESVNINTFHFKISNIFIIYGLFNYLKEQNIENNILTFCKKFLFEFISFLKKDIFNFGKVFFNFNKKIKNKSIINKTIESFNINDSININNIVVNNEDTEKDHKSVFKRLKKNILDDD